jgi:hypothetical protein
MMAKSINENSPFHDNKDRISFVAIDYKRKRVCVSTNNKKCTAVKVNGIWKNGYPEFEDLVDHYTALKDLEMIKKYTLEAINSMLNEHENQRCIVECKSIQNFDFSSIKLYTNGKLQSIQEEKEYVKV